MHRNDKRNRPLRSCTDTGQISHWTVPTFLDQHLQHSDMHQNQFKDKENELFPFYKRKNVPTVWIYEITKVTCQYNLMGNIYPHGQNVCSTCEYNICSFWIAKYLIIPSRDQRGLEREKRERENSITM